MSRIFKDRTIDVVSGSRDGDRRRSDCNTFLDFRFFGSSRLYQCCSDGLFFRQTFITLDDGKLKFTGVFGKEDGKLGKIASIHCVATDTAFDSKPGKGRRSTRNNSIKTIKVSEMKISTRSN
jgi:hypothetical protein